MNTGQVMTDSQGEPLGITLMDQVLKNISNQQTALESRIRGQLNELRSMAGGDKLLTDLLAQKPALRKFLP